MEHSANDPPDRRDISSITPWKEDFSEGLVVETVNATSWNSVQNWLVETKAHVLFIQETKIPETKVAEVSERVLKRGWKSLWSPASLSLSLIHI